MYLNRCLFRKPISSAQLVHPSSDHILLVGLETIPEFTAEGSRCRAVITPNTSGTADRRSPNSSNQTRWTSLSLNEVPSLAFREISSRLPMDSTSSKPHHHSHRRRRCLLISASVLLGVALLLVVLGLTVFRPRHATTTVNAVRVAGLHAGLDVPNLGVDLNVTLDLDITATNPNHARFRYGEGSADLYYRGALVGKAAIPPGEVSAGGSVRTDVLVTVLAGRLIGNAAVYADVIAGSVPFTTTTEIPGRVTVLGVFKHHMVSYTTCDIMVNVRHRTVDNSDCKYKTKL